MGDWAQDRAEEIVQGCNLENLIAAQVRKCEKESYASGLQEGRSQGRYEARKEIAALTKEVKSLREQLDKAVNGGCVWKRGDDLVTVERLLQDMRQAGGS